MLYLGTASETPEYEPYTNGASPNPDYPQEVEVIEGSVDVKVTTGSEEQTISVDLQDNFLAKIGDVKDELDVVTGKLTKRIGKVVLNGTETWQSVGTMSSDRSYCYAYTNDFDSLLSNEKTYYESSISESLQFKKGLWGGITIEQECFSTVGDTSSRLRLAIKTSRLSSVSKAGLTAYLSENPITIYYVLAEPYEVQLTSSTIPMEEGKVNNYSVTNSLVENLYCKYYTPYRGDDGTTPIKGVDYFTEADKQELINSIPSGGGGGNIETIEPEEGENYIYFFPNVVNKGLVDGTYYLTHTLKLATDSVGNTSGVSNNTTLFTFDTLVEIKEYIDANNSSIKSYDFIALNGNTIFITTENGVITEVMQSTLVTKAYVDNLFNSIVNGNEVSY
jgi:hypothetical protein